jgi:DNA-binding LacI/PurR family transcriptional regulator
LRKTTLEDVAAHAGVSRALASLVMRDSPRVSAASRQIVLASADQLGYRPNLMARNLAARRTMTLGVLLNDLHNQWFAEIADGIHEHAQASGYRVILGNGRRSLAHEDEALETFLAFQVDGIIITGCRLPDERIIAVGCEAPLVSIGRAIDSAIVSTVNSDDNAGAQLAIKHLVDLGHTNIVHIDGGSGAGAAPRRDGYLQAMALHGLDHFARVIPADFTERAGYAAVEELIASASLPTALFTANDLLAVGALSRIEQEGLSVPTDVSVVGYDNTSLAGLHHIGLTTVDQPREEMGRVACAELLKKMGDSKVNTHHVMSPALVERRTTTKAVGR